MKLNQWGKGYVVGLSLAIVAALLFILIGALASEDLESKPALVADHPWYDPTYWDNHVKGTEHTQVWCAEGIPYHLFHGDTKAIMPVPVPATGSQKADEILTLIWEACGRLENRRLESTEEK